MRTVSIFNVKGGVAKTISTTNIAACLSEIGKKVLIVDIDSQGNSSKLFKCYSIEDDSVTEVLLNKDVNIKNVIKKTDYENIDILPSNIKLTFAEKNILLDTTRQQQNRLLKALNQVSNEYDYCLIDCPTTLNIVTLNGLVASDEVIVPVKIDQFALDGLGDLLERIDEIKEELNPKLNFRGFFVTCDNSTTVNTVIKEQLKNFFGDKLLSTSIKNNVKVVESTFQQMPVIFSSKNCAASKNYRELTKELFE